MNVDITHKQPLPDIMGYESKIWEIADLLIASGIKQSDFPKYMMPYFALMMAEGRIRTLFCISGIKDGKRMV